MKRKDQPIKPGWKPTPIEEREPPDLHGCAFKSAEKDGPTVLRAASVYHAVHPDVPFKMALTMAWQRYWELEKT